MGRETSYDRRSKDEQSVGNISRSGGWTQTGARTHDPRVDLRATRRALSVSLAPQGSHTQETLRTPRGTRTHTTRNRVRGSANALLSSRDDGRVVVYHSNRATPSILVCRVTGTAPVTPTCVILSRARK